MALQGGRFNIGRLAALSRLGAVVRPHASGGELADTELVDTIFDDFDHIGIG